MVEKLNSCQGISGLHKKVIIYFSFIGMSSNFITHAIISLIPDEFKKFSFSKFTLIFLILLSKIFGDYILSYKIGSALLSSFYILSVYFLSKKLIFSALLSKEKISYEKSTSNKNKLISIFITTFVLFSPSLTFFTSQFPKNLMGILFYNIFLIALISKKEIFYKKQKFSFNFFWQFKYILLTFILCFIAHRFAAGIAIITISFTFLLYLIITKKYKLIIIGVALAGVTILFSIFFPGTLHLSDLERFKGLFTSNIQLATLSFTKIMGYKNISITWYFELYFLLFLFLLSTFFYLKKISNKKFIKEFQFKSIYTIILLLSLIMIFPFFNFEIIFLISSSSVSINFDLLFFLIISFILFESFEIVG